MRPITLLVPVLAALLLTAQDSQAFGRLLRSRQACPVQVSPSCSCTALPTTCPTCGSPSAAAAAGNPSDVFAYEEVNGKLIAYHRTEAGVDAFISRLTSLGFTPALYGLDKKVLLLSTCSTNSSGGCSGTCSVFPAMCLGFRFEYTGGKLFGCYCH